MQSVRSVHNNERQVKFNSKCTSYRNTVSPVSSVDIVGETSDTLFEGRIAVLLQVGGNAFFICLESSGRLVRPTGSLIL